MKCLFLLVCGTASGFAYPSFKIPQTTYEKLLSLSWFAVLPAASPTLLSKGLKQPMKSLYLLVCGTASGFAYPFQDTTLSSAAPTTPPALAVLSLKGTCRQGGRGDFVQHAVKGASLLLPDVEPARVVYHGHSWTAWDNVRDCSVVAPPTPPPRNAIFHGEIYTKRT